MDGRTHRTGGILFGAATPLIIEHSTHLSAVLPVEHIVPFTIASVIGAAVGSMIPDIDSPSSLVGRRVPFISKFISKTCGHRGFTHTLWALIAYAVAMFFLGSVLTRGLNGGFGMKVVQVILILILVARIINGTLIHRGQKASTIDLVVCAGLAMFFVYALFVGMNSLFINRLVDSIIATLVIASSVCFGLAMLNDLHKFVSKDDLKMVNGIVIVVTFVISFIFINAILSYIAVYIIGSVVGFFSHLFLDMLTVDGVVLFRGVSDFNIRLAHFHASTGGKIVKPICAILTVVCLIFVFI